MSFFPRPGTLLAVITASAVMTVTGCGSSGGGGNGNGDLSGAAANGVRFVHSALDGPRVDVYIDEEQVTDGTRYTEATGYFDPGTEDPVEVRVTEWGNDPSESIVSTTVQPEVIDRHTVVLYGEDGQEEIEVINDDTLIPHGFRFSHFGHDLGPVDVYLEQGANISDDPGELEPRYENMEAGDVAGWNVANPDEESRLILTEAGNEEEILLDTGTSGVEEDTLTLDEGEQIHIVLTSLSPDSVMSQRNFSLHDGIGLMQTPDASSVTSVKDRRLHLHIVNAVEDGGDLEVMIDDIAETAALAYQEGSAMIEITPDADHPEGARTFTVLDDNSNELHSQTMELDEGYRWRFVVMGSVQGDDLIFGSQPSQAPLHWLEDNEIFAHAAHGYFGFDVEKVHFTVDDSAFAIEDLAYGTVGSRLSTTDIEPDSEAQVYAECCLPLSGLIVEEFIGDIEDQSHYLFVMSGIHTGSEDPDLFYIQEPWVEIEAFSATNPPGI